MILTLSQTIIVLTQTLRKLNEIDEEEIFTDPAMGSYTPNDLAARSSIGIEPELTLQAGVLVRRIQEILKNNKKIITLEYLKNLKKVAKEDLIRLEECQCIDEKKKEKLSHFRNGHRKNGHGRQIIREKLHDF